VLTMALVASGNVTARPPARRLLQGDLNTSPAAMRAFDAVDANVVVYVTRDSIFEALVRVQM
jgi:hypothetical protein